MSEAPFFARLFLLFYFSSCGGFCFSFCVLRASKSILEISQILGQFNKESTSVLFYNCGVCM